MTTSFPATHSLNEVSMSLELYHAGLTTCSKKVRLCLAEKGIAYVSRFVSLATFEQHTPEYRRLNPDGVVPTLVHNGQPIVESMLINEYIEDCFPDIPLRPSDPIRIARMRYFTKLANDFGLMSVQYLTELFTIRARLAASHGALDSAGAPSPARLAEMAQTIPNPAARSRWLELASGKTDPEKLKAAGLAATRVVERIEAALNDEWLLGSDYSLADVDLLPFIDRYEQYHPAVLNDAVSPRTLSWLKRMRARPAVRKTYEPSAEAPAVNLNYRPESTA